jgi:hypothetical protein
MAYSDADDDNSRILSENINLIINSLVIILQSDTDMEDHEDQHCNRVTTSY